MSKDKDYGYKSMSDVGGRLVERLEQNGQLFQGLADSLRVVDTDHSDREPTKSKRQPAKRWTQEHIAILRREVLGVADASNDSKSSPRPPNSRSMLDWKRLGLQFGRDPHSVYTKAWKMGLTRSIPTPAPSSPVPTLKGEETFTTTPTSSPISPPVVFRRLSDEPSDNESSGAEWNDEVFE